MLNDDYYAILKKIALVHGEGVFYDARLFRALANDYAPHMQRESTQILNVIHTDGFERLRAGGQDREFVKNNMMKKLVQDLCISQAAAKWAVDTLSRLIQEVWPEQDKSLPAGPETVNKIKVSETVAPRIIKSRNKAIIKQSAAVSAHKHQPSGTENSQLLIENYSQIKIAIAQRHLAFLTPDGVARGFGDDFAGRCSLDSFGAGDIVDISVGFAHTVGLKRDGTLVAAGSGEFEQCSVKHFKNVVQVCCGAFHTAALTSEGNVLLAGGDNENLTDCQNWRHIVYLSSSGSVVAGIDPAGTVLVAGDGSSRELNARGWRHMRSVAVGPYHIIGLKKNGTLQACGDTTSGQCNVGGFHDIIKIAAGAFHSVAVNSSGRVFATGDNSSGQLATESFQGIARVLAGDTYTLAFDRKGKAFVAGDCRLWTAFEHAFTANP